MTWTSSAGALKLRSARWWIVAALLLLVGTGCLVVGLPGHQHPLAGPTHPAATSSHRQTAPSRPVIVTPVVARSQPVMLQIPAIGLTVPLSTLGLNYDGTVQVPTDYQQAGWFRLGPTPGQVGSAVILGHVDNHQGPAVFFQIRTLAPGDQVNVTLADGVTARFAVTSVAMYSKSQFPAQQVYGSNGSSTLQLVTCGGAFDTKTGSYLSNIVAYTTLVTTTPPATGA
jgi:sortase (surface protein transpeptidase)